MGKSISNRRNNQFTWNPHNKATILDCSFVVDSKNGNGLGIRSFKGSGRVSNAYMQVANTPTFVAPGNPNPAPGLIEVVLSDNYNRYLGGFDGFVSPVTTPAASMVVGNAYVITSLGTATKAQWATMGLPATITPAIGVSFIAASTIVLASATVSSTSPSGIDHIEVIGDPNLMNNSGATILPQGQGMTLILACYANGVLTAPTDGTVISLAFYMNDSAQGV